jgi:hypothetical protein
MSSWVAVPCSPVDWYHRFGGTPYLCLLAAPKTAADSSVFESARCRNPEDRSSIETRFYSLFCSRIMCTAGVYIVFLMRKELCAWTLLGHAVSSGQQVNKPELYSVRVRQFQFMCCFLCSCSGRNWTLEARYYGTRDPLPPEWVWRDILEFAVFGFLHSHLTGPEVN